MKLNLQKPIVFFDLETTGIDIVKDRIVELCYIRIEPDGSQIEKSIRVCPGKDVHIPEEASKVHGIYDADVAFCPTFKEIAHELLPIFEGADLAGFNSNHFDIPMLVEEFNRAGVDINLKDSRMVDVQNIYHKLEQRTLVAAYKHYCGKNLEDAHSALADTRATYEVLEAQLDRYPTDLENDVQFLANFSQRQHRIDFAGYLVYNEQGDEIVNFGKHKGKKAVDVLRADLNFFNWIQKGDFPIHTKRMFDLIRCKYARR